MTIENVTQLQNIADELEKLVDSNTVASVIEALALCCSAKADHIRSNWEANDPTAKQWDYIAGRLLTVAGAANARL